MPAAKVNVTARYVLADETPAAGRVVFTPTAPLSHAGDDNLLPSAQVSVLLDAAGSLSTPLYATDDPGWGTDWYYVVREEIEGAATRTWNLTVPTAAGPDLALADVAPVQPVDVVSSFVLQPTFDTHVAATTSVHGIADTSALALLADVQAAIAPLASTSYVDTAVTNLVDAAPSALDTLNELAAALGDDANFAATVTNSLVAKVDKATVLPSGSDTVLGTRVDGDVEDRFSVEADGTLRWSYDGNGASDVVMESASEGGFSLRREGDTPPAAPFVSLGNALAGNISGLGFLAQNIVGGFGILIGGGYYAGGLKYGHDLYGVAAIDVGIGRVSLRTADGGGAIGATAPLKDRFKANADGPVEILPRDAATLVAKVKGAAGQTADLQQWQNSAGTALTWVEADGSIHVGTNASIYLVGGQDQLGLQASNNVQVKSPQFHFGDATSITQSNNIDWGLGNRNVTFRTTGSGRHIVEGVNVVTVPSVVKAAPSQTADLTQWQNSAETVLSGIGPNGNLRIRDDASVNGIASGTAIAVAGGTSAGSVKGLDINTSGTGEWLRVGSSGVQLRVENPSGFVRVGGFGVPTLLQPYTGGVNSLITKPYYNGGVSLTVDPFSASQTADLQQWRNSAGTALAFVNNAGNLTARKVHGGGADPNSNAALTASPLGSALPALVLRGAASQSVSLARFEDSTGTALTQISQGGHLLLGQTGGTMPSAGTSAVGDKISLFTDEYGFGIQAGRLVAFTGAGAAFVVRERSLTGDKSSGADGLRFVPGTASIVFGAGADTNLFRDQADILRTNDSMRVDTGFAIGQVNPTATSRLQVYAGAATDKVIVARGAASQTANLQEWQDSAGTVLASITSGGSLKSNLDANGGNYAVDSASVLGLRSTSSFGGGAMFISTPNSHIRLIGGGLSVDNIGRVFWGQEPPRFGGGQPMRIFPTDGADVDSLDIRPSDVRTGPMVAFRPRTFAGTNLSQINLNGEYENVTAGNGIILKSPGGTRYRVSVDNAGNLATAAL